MYFWFGLGWVSWSTLSRKMFTVKQIAMVLLMINLQGEKLRKELHNNILVIPWAKVYQWWKNKIKSTPYQLVKSAVLGDLLYAEAIPLNVGRSIRVFNFFLSSFLLFILHSLLTQHADPIKLEQNQTHHIKTKKPILLTCLGPNFSSFKSFSIDDILLLE